MLTRSSPLPIVVLTLRVPAAVAEMVRAVAAEERTSLNAWVVEAIRERLLNLARRRTTGGASPTSPAWYADTAREHAAADARCGRAWSCTCGACRTARQPIAGGSDADEADRLGITDPTERVREFLHTCTDYEMRWVRERESWCAYCLAIGGECGTDCPGSDDADRAAFRAEVQRIMTAPEERG